MIGRHLDVPVASIPQNEAADHFACFAEFLSVDAPASSVLTRDLRDWQPTQPGRIEDLEQGHYYQRANPQQQHTALTA